jgi:glycosyltransferase involved in cell wall biosynthesis
MHRSGTSLVASFLAASGVGMGERLLAADARNPRGYFEDADFVELQGRILRECTPSGDGGHPDWGWTEGERIDRDRLPEYRAAARALLDARAGRAGIWGWKDPRTTLLLDFWDEILNLRPTGGALHVLPYRLPWEVADSMQRLGAGVFLDHPEYAYRIWTFYNRHLLDFYRRHPDRCLLVSTNALLREPGRFAALLSAKLGLDASGAALESVRDDGLFSTLGASDPLGRLVAAAWPECARLLAELDAAADLPATGLWDASPPSSTLTPSDTEPVDLSIVIPCYDQGEFLLEAVASAERSYLEGDREGGPRTELIVVDDGSRQPRTLEVLGVLRAAGYRVISQENGGLAAARNRGIGEARGRYVLPLDADNRLRPGFPGEAVRVLDGSPEVGVVYGDRWEFGLRNRRVPASEFDPDKLLWVNFIDACAVLRREVWARAGGYDAGAAAWEDWELWVSAVEQGWGFHRLPSAAGIAFDYRVRPHSMLAERTEEERQPIREYILAKHAALYQRRLGKILRLAQLNAAEAHGRVHALEAERDRLARENARLESDLHWLRRHISFVEGTRAWKLRGLLLKLRGR